MITLTTLLDEPGFAMYLDGNLSAEMNPYSGNALRHSHQSSIGLFLHRPGKECLLTAHQVRAVLEAGFATVNGGYSMNLTDNIYLCGRTRNNQSRGFDGLLAELLLFDTPLTKLQIEALYWIAVKPFIHARRVLT